MELLDGPRPDPPGAEVTGRAPDAPPAGGAAAGSRALSLRVPVETLDEPPDVPPAPPRPGRAPFWRRWGALALALAVGVAAGMYATATHDAARARATAAATARSVVDLAVLHVSASLDNEGELRVVASLRNRGPRPLVIRAVRLGRVSLGGADADVPAGQVWPGVGIRTGGCPVLADVLGPLVVDVRTADGAARTVSLQPGRDFLPELADFPDPGACHEPGFEAAYVEAGLVSATRHGARGTRLVLSLVAQLPQGAQRARILAVGVDEPGIATRTVSGLPATVSTGVPAVVTVDVTAPSCSRVQLPSNSTAGPYLSFRGQILPHGTASRAPGYEANTVLVAVLRMLARACPSLLAD